MGRQRVTGLFRWLLSTSGYNSQIFSQSRKPRQFSDYSSQPILVRHLCTSEVSNTSTEASVNMDLGYVVRQLQRLAPTSLAESWDNVGLLVEPSPPHTVSTLFLTNDLTEPVLQEAMDVKANFILSYHPPIFVPMKTLTQRTWKERIIVRCVENRIAVYSPHTTYDAVKDGLSDWLISPFVGRVCPLHPSTSSSFFTQGKHRAEFTVTSDIAGQVLKAISKINGVEVTVSDGKVGDSEVQQVSCCCTDKGLTALVEAMAEYEDTRTTLQIMALNKPPLPGHGGGRICKLKTAVTLADAVAAVKSHLKLSHVRLAKAVGADERQKIKQVAVCAGSGSQVLRGADADLYITGEMSHHEVLEAVSRGISVILCDHSNTERGYLTVLQQKLTELFENKISVVTSKIDADPLQIV